MSGYLTLEEAAQYVQSKTAVPMDAVALLRAGVHGALLIAAPFSATMRNLVSHADEEVSGLLVIPTRHLLNIETEGQARIIGASSLDGKVMYAPHVVRTVGQLRVLVSELDRFVSNLATDTAHSSSPAVAPAPSAPAAIVQKQRVQEEQIIEMLSGGGYSPEALPHREPGYSGVKSIIRAQALALNGMFTASSFDKAWQRLRDDGRLKGD